jgi:hypothetical protein
MSSGVAPERFVRADARDSGFYALVSHVGTGLFSKKVGGLTVDVLSGTVNRGDPLELVSPDGGTTRVVGHALRDAPIDDDQVLDLDEPRPLKEELGPVELVRSPWLEAPQLPLGDDQDGLQRLLEAVRSARAQGFPEDQAVPIRPTMEVTAEKVCSQLRRLPDEADVLLIRSRVRRALRHHANPFDLLPACEKAALYLAAVGLPDDGDELLLGASAALQGHNASPALRAFASAAATTALSIDGGAKAATDVAGRVGWALGIEMGDGFGVGFKSGMAAPGEAMETTLLKAGRAVALAWCKKCHAVVTLDLGASGLTGSRQLRCPTDGRKADDSLIVVPSKAAAARRALQHLH